MQPLYTEAEFKEAKSRQLLPLQCKQCEKKFYKAKHVIQKAISGMKAFKSDFCSYQCLDLFQHPPIVATCGTCGHSFRCSPKALRKSKSGKVFCNQSCAAKYSNAHKTKGTRISKLEVWLSKQLPSLYPDLEFHFNRKDAINGELDIYIPSLKLAFELNGIFHYEPIFGKEQLSKIQTNDARKSQACYEHNIELCLIDVSHQKYFKEQTSTRFLIIIQNIINSKLSRSLPASSAVSSQHHVEVP